MQIGCKGVVNFTQKEKGFTRQITQTLSQYGGAEGDRTPDLLNAIQARSQLRHSPNFSVILQSKVNDFNRFPH